MSNNDHIRKYSEIAEIIYLKNRLPAKKNKIIEKMSIITWEKICKRLQRNLQPGGLQGNSF